MALCRWSHQFKIESDSKKPLNLSFSDRLFMNPNRADRIPDSATYLQFRLCEVAFTGSSGHHGLIPAKKALRQRYYWSILTMDIRSFRCAYIHHLSRMGGGTSHILSKLLSLEVHQMTCYNSITWRLGKPVQVRTIFDFYAIIIPITSGCSHSQAPLQKMQHMQS